MSDKDIRTDPKTVATYWAMMGKTGWNHKLRDGLLGVSCQKCSAPSDPPNRTLCSEKGKCPVPDPITMSVAELAEYMMKQCEDIPYIQALAEVLNRPYLGDYGWKHSTPEQRIEAATTARRQKGTTDGESTKEKEISPMG